jgi:DNA-binding beta-propeller fold protein YncE
MNGRIFAGVATVALSMIFTAMLAFSQTRVAAAESPSPEAACGLSNFCGIPYVYVPAKEPQSPAGGAASSADGAARQLGGGGATLVDGVARAVGGRVGWGTVCFGSPVCVYGIGRNKVIHTRSVGPDLGYTYAYPLTFPNGTSGGVSAVAMNSKGHLFAFVRNTPGKPQLFEWDQNYKLVKAWGEDIAYKAHGMAIDAQDNIWICDQFGDTVMKLSPEGKLLLTLGVKGKRGDWDEAKGIRLLWQPEDVAFAPNGDIYIGMGHANESPNDGAARVLHLDKNGKFINQWFGDSPGPGKFSMVHGLTVNPLNGNVYIADREEYRIVVYDGNGTFIKTIQMANLACTLYVDPHYQLWMATGLDGQIEKLDWDGNVLGSAGLGPGRGPGQFAETNYMGMDSHGNMFVGDTSVTRVTELVASPGSGRP